MATSFLICYPDVPARALVRTPSVAYDADYPVESTLYGRRHNYAQRAATGSSVAVTYDLGAGNSRTVDHFILGGARLLKANGVTQATLQGSSDGSTWVNQLGTASAFQTRTFDGPDDEDVIFTAAYNDQYAATLAAYRYFKVTLAGGSNHLFPVSKIFFGAAFDMGREPDSYDVEILTEKDSDTWVYDRGHTPMAKAFYPQHRFTVEWDEVTDAKATEFTEKVLKNPYRDSVFLYASTHNDPLYDNRLVYCKVVDSECSVEKQNEDWNLVKCVFTQEAA